MPYKTDKLKLGKSLSRRVKMQPHQKEEAKQLHKTGTSINAIARTFKVSKRLIQFILFPERQQKNLQDRAKRGGTMVYYDKDYHKEKIKSHRRYKHAVLTGKSTDGMTKTKEEVNSAFEKSDYKRRLDDKVRKDNSRNQLKDWYVVSNLKQRTNLTSQDIKEYPALVEAMRTNLKFKRAIQKLQ